MVNGRKNNVKTSLFLAYISLNSPKGCLVYLQSAATREPLGKPTVYSPFLFLTLTHTFPSLIPSFSYTDLFTFLSLMQQLVYICFPSFTCSLFFPPFLALTYIHKLIYSPLWFPHWSPFEKHLIRKACEAHMSSPHRRTHLLPPFFSYTTNSSLLLHPPCIFFQTYLVSLRALPD